MPIVWDEEVKEHGITWDSDTPKEAIVWDDEVSTSLKASTEPIPVTRSTVAGSFARPTDVGRQDGLFQRLSPMEREQSVPKLLSPEEQAASDEEVRQLITGETTAFGGPLPEITGAEMQSAIPALRDYPNVASVIANISNAGTKPLVDFPRTLPGAAMMVAAPSAGLTGAAGVAGKTVLGKFIWDALQHIPHLVKDTENAIRSGDPGRIAGAVTSLTLNTAVAIGVGKGLKGSLAREGVQQTVMREVIPTETETFSPKGTFRQFTERADAIDVFTAKAKDAGLPNAARALEAVVKDERVTINAEDVSLETDPAAIARIEATAREVEAQSKAETPTVGESLTVEPAAKPPELTEVKPAEAAPAVPIQITIADFDTKGRLKAQATMPIQEAAQKIRARESMLQSLLNCLKGIKKS